MSFFSRRPTRAYLSLGTNVGDRLAIIEQAVRAIAANDDVTLADVSGVYETQPWGGVEQGPYLNLVMVIDTTFAPRELLGFCQSVEAWFGRDRATEERWGPRTLDVDVLLYGTREIDTPDLTVPHPRLHERAFVLVPLLEVMPGGTLPDGRRLSSFVNALAPLEGIDLHVRLDGLHDGIARPAGPPSPGAVLAEDWERQRPHGAPPGTER